MGSESLSITSTSRSLLERARGADGQAWSDLVKLYGPLLAFWCRRAGLPDQEIADVVQDVFRSVLSNLDKFRRERPGDTFRGWLRTIARNKVIDFFRRSQKQPQAAGGSIAAENLAAIPEFDDELESDEESLREQHGLFLRAIELIREDFQPKTWSAFWKMVVETKSAAEAGEELGMTAGAVRVAKSRVLQRLRWILGEVDE